MAINQYAVFVYSESYTVARNLIRDYNIVAANWISSHTVHKIYGLEKCVILYWQCETINERVQEILATRKAMAIIPVACDLASAHIDDSD